jgi:probable rRNA maturation factor
LSVSRLQIRAKKALKILEKKLPKNLEQIEVYCVSCACIAGLHKKFLNDFSPTDVITFEHGEIFICPQIAQKQRKTSGFSLENELLTYIIHGLLHLCGLDDHGKREFENMQKMQTKILNRVVL